MSAARSIIKVSSKSSQLTASQKVESIIASEKDEKKKEKDKKKDKQVRMASWNENNHLFLRAGSLGSSVK